MAEQVPFTFAADASAEKPEAERFPLDEEREALGKALLEMPDESPADSAPESSLDTMPLEQLKEAYRRAVGISARPGMEHNALITGIENPEAEQERIRQIDRESDQDDITRTYR